MAERSGRSVVMEFSPSEVFIPHSKETLLQPLALVAYVAVRGGDGGGRGGLVLLVFWAVGRVETGIWEGIMTASCLDPLSHESSSSPSTEERQQKKGRMKGGGSHFWQCICAVTKLLPPPIMLFDLPGPLIGSARSWKMLRFQSTPVFQSSKMLCPMIGVCWLTCYSIFCTN